MLLHPVARFPITERHTTYRTKRRLASGQRFVPKMSTRVTSFAGPIQPYTGKATG